MAPPAVAGVELREIASASHGPAVALGVQGVGVLVGGLLEFADQSSPIESQAMRMCAVARDRIPPVYIAVEEADSVGQQASNAEPLIELGQVAHDGCVVDGVHPNDAGMKSIGEGLVSPLRDMIETVRET